MAPSRALFSPATYLLRPSQSSYLLSSRHRSLYHSSSASSSSHLPSSSSIQYSYLYQTHPRLSLSPSPSPTSAAPISPIISSTSSTSSVSPPQAVHTSTYYRPQVSQVKQAVAYSSVSAASSSSIVEEAEEEAEAGVTSAERAIKQKLVGEFGGEDAMVEVKDVSGGCGSMYAIEIASKRFEGLSMIKQHRLVNEVLKEEVGGWHGLQLKTRAL